jgi:hypothetical protein
MYRRRWLAIAVNVLALIVAFVEHPVTVGLFCCWRFRWW